MAFTAFEVMKRASTILQDEDAVRWTAPELHGYVNDALREIVTIKPNALAKTVNLDLRAGTLQELPQEYTVLSRVTRNMTDANTGSTAIRPLAKREIMDSHLPGWQSQGVMPYGREVVHVIHDLADPRSYYVVPGNDGNGLIEAVVGAMPEENAAPAGLADQLVLENYTNQVDMPDIYQNAIVDYILYRAYSKDSRMSGSAQRAQAHFELFRAAIGGFGSAEAGIALATYTNPSMAASG